MWTRQRWQAVYPFFHSSYSLFDPPVHPYFNWLGRWGWGFLGNDGVISVGWGSPSKHKIQKGEIDVMLPRFLPFFGFSADLWALSHGHCTSSLVVRLQTGQVLSYRFLWSFLPLLKRISLTNFIVVFRFIACTPTFCCICTMQSFDLWLYLTGKNIKLSTLLRES